MPNWCKNFLRVNGPKEDLTQFVKQAEPAKPNDRTTTAAPPEAFSFQRLVPLSPSLGTATGDEASSPTQRWGCRGDAVHSESDEFREGAVQYRFATSWNPPLNFLREVSTLWPTLEFVLDYDEPMMAFYGTARAQAGRLIQFHFET